MFFSKSSLMIRGKDDALKVIEIYKKGGKTFRLFCETTKAAGTMGENFNYCVSLLTQNGFVVIADNRMLDIPEVDSKKMSKEEVLSKVHAGFEEFKRYADIIA
jgi:hypothetical protein